MYSSMSFCIILHSKYYIVLRSTKQDNNCCSVQTRFPIYGTDRTLACSLFFLLRFDSAQVAFKREKKPLTAKQKLLAKMRR